MARSLRLLPRVFSKSCGACRGAVPAFTHAIVLLSCVAGFTATLPLTAAPVAAAEMDKNAKSDAKTAMRFYKEGNYEDAAKIFLKLSVAYPDMLVFVRNLGACYYYLRRYEPALSNLRDYEHRKKDMAPDDRAEVAGWIGEMERLRDQASAAGPPATMEPSTSPALAVVPAPVPTPPVPTPPAAAPSPSPGLTAPSSPTPAAGQPAQTVENANLPQGQYGTQPQPTYPQGRYGTQPQSYPSGPYGAQPPPAYPPGRYGAQLQPYPQGQYGAQPGQPGYPTTQYPPANAGYPPTYQPSAYPQGGYPAGVAKQGNPPPSSGGGRRAAAWILGVMGGAGLAAGGVFTALALDRFSKVQKKYDPAAEKQGKEFATLQWVCYGSGAALLTTAIIVAATGGRSSPAVALAPAVGPAAAGATLSGSF